MITNIRKYDYGLIEAETASSKWGEPFHLMCTAEDQLPYAEKCRDYLDDLPAEMEKRLALYLNRYYTDCEQDYDEEHAESETVNEDNIFSHIRISSVIVDEACRTDRIEFHVDGECDWEPEHGLEITISNGKILYVGPFENYGPNSAGLKYALEHWGWFSPDVFPIMNYADEE